MVIELVSLIINPACITTSGRNQLGGVDTHFTITTESLRAHWLIFIVNKRTETDRDMKFIIYAILTERARAEPIESVRFFY